MWERLGIALNDRYQMALGLNSLLLRSQGKTVLIETGVGEKERPRAQTDSARARGTCSTSCGRSTWRPRTSTSS